MSRLSRRSGVLRSVARLVLAGMLYGVAAEEDAGSRWLSVYSWLRTAERLAGEGHLPLALGGYLEASRRLEELAKFDPNFEPEMVAYRREALSLAVAGLEGGMTDDEHGTMMRFLDFVESLEAGERQRYGNDFAAAYETLSLARSVLEELTAEKPDSFLEAVAAHSARLDSSLDWLGQQLEFKAASALASRPPATGTTADWGTTRFVKLSDLPASSGSGELAPALFPASLLAAGRAGTTVSPSAPVPGAESREAAGKTVRFRMSSRQDRAEPTE